MKILKETEIRGWFLFILMLLVSLFWKDVKVTVGIFTGGIVALFDFRLMRVLMVKMVLARKGMSLFVSQLFKYLLIGVIFAALFLFDFVNPIATIIGLSILFFMPITQLPGLAEKMKEVA